MIRTELPLSHHGIEGIGLLGSMPKIARKAWRSDVEAGFRGQLVAKQCSVLQTSGFTAPDAIVNGVNDSTESESRFHAFRRFRLRWLRKNGVPKDLERYWMGHAETEVSDLVAQGRCFFPPGMGGTNWTGL